VGKDRGFLWRLDTYWRMAEKNGGVYIQNESVELSRTFPRSSPGSSILSLKALSATFW